MSKAREWDDIREAEQNVFDLNEEYRDLADIYSEDSDEIYKIERELTEAENHLRYLEDCWKSDYGHFPEERPTDV